MKLKKLFITTALGFSLLSFGTGASAEEKESDLVDSDAVQSTKQLIDTDSFSTMATPTNSSSTNVHSPVFSFAYGVAVSSSTVMEDFISAKCRTFDGDGHLINSKTSEEKGTSYASVKANNTTAYLGNDWAIGNHIYKLSGYKDVVHETRAEW